MFDFEKFHVYQRAESLYVKVLEILSSPKIDKNIKNQLKRAALSIILNIAEGAGKYSKKDKKNFYTISKGSTNECVAIIRILKLENKITEDLFQRSYADLWEVGKMLSGLINTMTGQKTEVIKRN